MTATPVTDRMIREGLGCSAELLERFLRYVAEPDVLDQMVEVLLAEHPTVPEGTLRGMLTRALDRVYTIEFQRVSGGRQFDLRVLLGFAPSFELLVRIARRLSQTREHVFPAELIPNIRTVEAILKLFRVHKGFVALEAPQAAG